MAATELTTRCKWDECINSAEMRGIWGVVCLDITMIDGDNNLGVVWKVWVIIFKQYLGLGWQIAHLFLVVSIGVQATSHDASTLSLESTFQFPLHKSKNFSNKATLVLHIMPCPYY